MERDTPTTALGSGTLETKTPESPHVTSYMERLQTLYATQVAAGGDTAIEFLAQKMGVSPRSLQRRLQRHGTSHRAMLAAARCTASKSLLEESQMTIDEVARTVGFSERRAFERAFRRWTGTTPAAHRKTVKAQQMSAPPVQETHAPLETSFDSAFTA